VTRAALPAAAFPSSQPDSTILFLHGLLSQIADPPVKVGSYIPFLARIVGEGGSKLAKSRVLAPIAPIRNITASDISDDLKIGRAWFDIIAVVNANASAAEIAAIPVDTLGLYRATERIAEIVQAEHAVYKIPPTKIFLLGHSLGASMALHASLFTDIPFAGVCSLAGFIPQIGDLIGPAAARAVNSAGKVYNFLLIHGTEDATVPLAVGQFGAAVLGPIITAFRQKLIFTPKFGLDHASRLLIDPSTIADISSTIAKAVGLIM
jgi:Phospholipase/Carboxylesterase